MKRSKTQRPLVIFFITLFITYLIPILLTLSIPIFKQYKIPSIILTIIGSLLSFGVAYWAIKKDSISFEEIGLVFKKLLEALLITILVWTIFGIFIYTKDHLALTQEGETLINQTPVLFMIHWIFVGFAEELLFRGYFFTSIKKYFSKYNKFLAVILGLLISSFIFATFHIPVRIVMQDIGTNYAELLGTLKTLFFTGLVFGWLFYRSKNLFLVAFIHGGMNAPLIGVRGDLMPIIIYIIIVELYVLIKFIRKKIKNRKKERW